MAAAIRAEVTRMDRELVAYNVTPLSDIVGRGIARERFALVLMGAFAAVALALASLGLYGVLAYSVRQRTQEIGIRMALGATARQVRGLILRQAGAVIAGGIAIGIGGALAMGRWLASLLYETSPHDPAVLMTTVVLLIGVALGAAWLPAWRASRLDPTMTMRED
jgi:ABC-type antimicrobial peptide transport system permease subunit